MGKIQFCKYQGAGNDFIVIDNREESFVYNNELIRQLCDRHFGIGSDGLMLLENDSAGSDFYMRYFNADGSESTMCGNGGRCIATFARLLGIAPRKLEFNSVDGLHTAEILNNEGSASMVKLKMIDVEQVHEDDDFYYLNTGSPHHVVFVDELDEFDVVSEGRRVRNSDMYAPDGTNVNFVQLLDDVIYVRTFERGVEDETLSCGTGATASAIATALFTESDETVFNVRTIGGMLKVSFERYDDGSFRNIYLEGPATFIFEGKLNSL
ncbi:MAG: diaminopimelate epimerase [Prevotellaceae bacterium]|jgi:diaminopimelate epimerase|nr:diaminopimelate epimerase [Prevotellaceae bacterium]